MTNLDRAIDAFILQAVRDGFDTRIGAQNCCDYASNEFLHVLSDFGIEGIIEHFESSIVQDVEDYPFGLGNCSYHWAVRVGWAVIDWTARQFDETAPFPAIWECPKRTWRNC